MELLLLEEEKRNLRFKKQSEKSSSGTEKAEKGRNRLFEELKENGEVGSPAHITKSATIAIWRSHFVLKKETSF